MSPDVERGTLAFKVGEELFALEDDHTYHLGSSPLCEVRIAHSTVSQRHAVVVCRGGRVAIEDLNSTNGTRIDDRPVQRAEIKPGQKIRLGAIELELIDPTRLVGPPPRKIHQHLGLRLRDQATFSELMAHELRRAPWFTLSAVIHILVFVALYYMYEQDLLDRGSKGKLTLAEREEDAVIEDLETPPMEDIRLEDEAIAEQLTDDPLEPAFDAPTNDDERFEVEIEPDPGLSGGENWLQAVKKGGKGILGNAGVRAGGFGKTVSEFRRSGLEIVFVFDSTASMGSILEGTKETISEMVELLHALVPDARIGIVTYRDRDPSEDYTTRTVPLGFDVYRVINFTHIISAGGGGNRPEAVLDGLRKAFDQRWHPKAQRVVVLIGDAPAHDYDGRKINRLVRGFVANGRSQVHAIVTSPYTHSRQEADTRASFKWIAEIGKGECIDFEDNTTVLQQVMSLAFGRKFRRNLDEASRLISSTDSKVATFALDAVQRQDIDTLKRKLRVEPVSDDVVKALSRSDSPAIARFLIDVLTDSSFPEPGRQAAAFALQRTMRGRFANEVDDILRTTAAEGRDSNRKPWELGSISSRKERELRKQMD